MCTTPLDQGSFVFSKRPVGGRRTLRHYQNMLRDAERKERDAPTHEHRKHAQLTITLYRNLIRQWHGANKNAQT